MVTVAAVPEVAYGAVGEAEVWGCLAGEESAVALPWYDLHSKIEFLPYPQMRILHRFLL